MEQTTNILGAAIFWLYIVAALAFTGLVIDSIARQQPQPTEHVPPRQRPVWIFCVLALLSFSTLSFNMLHVLIASYRLWSWRRFPTRAILSNLSLGNIWRWSVGSSLFQDFGNAIVEDEGRYLWTQTALLVTFSVCLFMASQGHRLNLPRLWAFFALSQILPISFAQNLFYIAALRSASDAKKTSFPRNRTLRVIAGYCACLLVAPQTAGGPYLMPTILITRLLLLLPFFLRGDPRPSKSKLAGRVFSNELAQQVLATFAVALTAKQGYLVHQAGLSAADVARALISQPAVTSLGADLIMSTVSFIAWKVMGI